MSRRKVVGTANFAQNIDGLRAFHTEHPAAFERAIGKLQDEVLPLLRLQPNVGRLASGSSKQPIIERIRLRLGGGMLRELPVNDYMVLYLVGAKQVVLLSMRHQRELEFDFGD